MKKLVTATFILVAAFGFSYAQEASAAAPLIKIVNPPGFDSSKLQIPRHSNKIKHLAA
jgi:hypothetical protein